MTVPTTTSSVTYSGNGATTIWSFSFIGVDGDDLEVILTNSSGVESVINPSLYTLVINPVPVGGLWGIGGYVVYPISGSPIAVGTQLTINRIVPYEQNVSISNQGAFYPTAVEQAIDLLELQIQQLETQIQTILSEITINPNPPTIPPSATPRIVSVTTTQTVNVLTSDSFSGISIYQSGSAVTTVQLPVGYGPFPIFDGSNNSSSFPIVVLPPSGLQIEGSDSFLVTFDGQSVTFYNDGNEVLAQ